VALATVQDCLRRFAASGLSWPVDLDAEALAARLYPQAAKRCAPPLPDFVAIQQSLAGHKAMTRQHLWERYREDLPDGLRNAQGILRLSRDFTAARLQEACRRALGLKTLSYRAVRRLIERVEAPPAPQPNTSPNRWQAQCLLPLQSGPHRALMAAARHLSTTGWKRRARISAPNPEAP
jgi:hypothetical protein